MSEEKSKVPSIHKQQQIVLDESRKLNRKPVAEKQPQHEAVESVTGTIRKNTFKAIKPNSLKNSSEIEGNKDLQTYILCSVNVLSTDLFT